MKIKNIKDLNKVWIVEEIGDESRKFLMSILSQLIAIWNFLGTTFFGLESGSQKQIHIDSIHSNK